MRKIAALLAVLVLLTGFLVSCNEEAKLGDESTEGTANTLTSQKPIEAPPAQDASKAEAAETGLQPNPVRTDADGLVSIEIKNGEALLTYHLDRWNEKYGIYNQDFGAYDKSWMKEGPFPVQTHSGTVVDACIGQIEEFGNIGWGEVLCPTVILLMDNGSLEQFIADPFIGEDTDLLYTFRKLNWIDEVDILTYEKEKDGIGENTIYATDKKGLRYDLRFPIRYDFLTQWSWITPIYGSEEDSNENFYGYLTLMEDGNAKWMTGWKDSDAAEVYEGTYEISFAEQAKDSEKPGILNLNLDLVWNLFGEEDSEYAAGLQENLTGSYFIDTDSSGYLHLYPSSGDLLFGREPEEGQPFVFDILWENYEPTDHTILGEFDTSLFSEKDLIEYLTLIVPKAKEMMEIGMTAVVIEEISTIEGVTCRDVILGTSGEFNFTQEFYYTIAPDGTVYQMDMMTGDWVDLIENPDFSLDGSFG